MEKIKVPSSGGRMNPEEVIKMIKESREISSEEAVAVLGFLRKLAKIKVTKYLEERK